MFSKQPEDKRQRKSQTSPKVLTRELVVCGYFIVNLHTVFYSTPFWGRVYKWKFCLSICLSVCLSVITSYSFPSDSKLTQHPPVNLNHATSPTSYIWGRVMCQPDIFFYKLQRKLISCPSLIENKDSILRCFFEWTTSQ